MKFTANTDELNKALHTLTKTASGNRICNPILEGVLLKVSGDTLTMRTTNLVTTVTITTNVTDAEDGEAVINARTLANILKNMPSEEVGFASAPSPDNNPDSIIIAWSTGKSSLPDLGTTDFPNIPEVTGETVEMENMLLKTAADLTADSTATDELHPVMNGICFDFKKETQDLNVAATNAHELAVVSLPLSGESPGKQYVIPTQMLTLLNSVTNDEGTTRIICSDRNMKFETGNTTITGTLIEGKFPAYESVFPQPESIFTVNKQEAAAILKRVGLAAPTEKPFVTIRTDENHIEVKAQDTVRGISSKDIIPVIMSEGDSGEYNYIASTLAKMLDRVPSDNVKLGFTTPNKPVLISPADGNTDFRALLMPVIIKENK